MFGQNAANLEPIPISNADENRFPARRTALHRFQLPFPSAPNRGLRKLHFDNFAGLPTPGTQFDRQTNRPQLDGHHRPMRGQNAHGRQLR